MNALLFGGFFYTCILYCGKRAFKGLYRHCNIPAPKAVFVVTLFFAITRNLKVVVVIAVSVCSVTVKCQLLYFCERLLQHCPNDRRQPSQCPACCSVNHRASEAPGASMREPHKRLSPASWFPVFKIFWIFLKKTQVSIQHVTDFLNSTPNFHHWLRSQFRPETKGDLLTQLGSRLHLLLPPTAPHQVAKTNCAVWWFDQFVCLS